MTPMLRLKDFAERLAEAFDFSPRRYCVDRDGFSTDAKNLRADFSSVSKDMRRVLKHEQADQRAA